MLKNRIFLFIIFGALIFIPVSPQQKKSPRAEWEEFADISIDFLKPELLFDALKKNLRVPEFKDGKIELPKSVISKDFSFDIGKYNKDEEEETGVNPLKFFNWLFGLLSRIFASIADFFGNAGGSAIP